MCVRITVAFGLSLGWVVTAFGQSEPERYANREFGVYFDVPAGWTLERRPEEGLASLSDSLGLLEIVVTARIIPKKKDVRGFADELERGRGLAGKGVAVRSLVEDPAFAETKREVLKPFVYDDAERADKAREEYEKGKAKRPADVGDGRGEPGAIPGEQEFLAEMTSRLYEADNIPVTRLVFYVIGGGVGYTVTVAAAREDFYAALPLAHDAVTAMKLDKLSGGRYALPDVKTFAVAKKGIIMGKVLSNGLPVGGAAVNLYADAVSFTKGVPSHRALSNGYGEYTFAQLEAGRYYLLEVYGVSDEGERVRSVQPITNIDVVKGRIVFVNIEVSRAP
jgi:hypothetical protein